MEEALEIKEIKETIADTRQRVSKIEVYL